MKKKLPVYILLRDINYMLNSKTSIRINDEVILPANLRKRLEAINIKHWFNVDYEVKYGPGQSAKYTRLYMSN